MLTDVPEFEISLPEFTLKAQLTIPKRSKAVVIFAHGIESVMEKARHQYVAGLLNESGIATLLVDLLSEEEKNQFIRTWQTRVTVGLLADRIRAATQWIQKYPESKSLPIGYFGSRKDVAAILVAASRLEDMHYQSPVKLIVSWAGRSDLVDPKGVLRRLTVPTLFIVESRDRPIIGINKKSIEDLRHVACRELVIIPEAFNLFEEPDRVRKVATVAVDWYRYYLLASPTHLRGTPTMIPRTELLNSNSDLRGIGHIRSGRFGVLGSFFFLFMKLRARHPPPE